MVSKAGGEGGGRRGVLATSPLSLLARLACVVCLCAALGLWLPTAARADAASPAAAAPGADIAPVATVAPGDVASPAADTTPPTTLVLGDDDLWHDAPVELTFSASDDPGGSGVAATYVKIDAGPYEPAATVTIAAPADHSNDGPHTVSYYSLDNAGNAESPQSCTVLIDTSGPTIVLTASRPIGDRNVVFSFRVDDDLAATAGQIVLVVTDSHQRVVRQAAWAQRAVGTTYTVRWRPPAQDTYTCRVTAADSAGNAARQPGVAKLLARGPWWRTIGRSVRGRSIVEARFGSGARRVLFVGGVHGNECGTAVATRLVTYLCAHPRAVPAAASITVIRCLNPDGLALGTRGNARRVDLNRNLPSRNWRSELDPASEPRGLGLTGGRSPGSEPETKALLACLRSCAFRAVVSLHSRGGLLDCSGPGAAALGRLMAAHCGFALGGVGYDAAITGSLGDFVPERYRVPVVTVELRRGALTAGLRAALLAAARGR